MSGVAGRAATLRAILAAARTRAEQHVRSAERQFSHSTATQQRMRDIHRVLSGGADAAFSMIDNPRECMSPLPDGAGFTGVFSARKLVTKGGSLPIHTAPARITTTKVANPTLQQATQGMDIADGEAATQFAARYNTAAVNNQLKNMKDRTASFRADLHKVALQTNRALARTRSQTSQAPAASAREQ